jgi:hypothetical protein
MRENEAWETATRNSGINAVLINDLIKSTRYHFIYSKSCTSSTSCNIFWGKKREGV